MKSIDWSRWAVVAHNDDTGFGRMAVDLKSILGIRRHLIIPSERLQDKRLEQSGEIMLDPRESPASLRVKMAGLQGVIFFERHSWHPDILQVARDLGVFTVCVPMWEWFRGTDAQWKQVDLFACPNCFSFQIVRSYGFHNIVQLPWSLDLSRFPLRRISGSARVFVHNAGLVDHDDRKGTRETIVAFKRVARRNIRLIVRMQQAAELPELDERIEVSVGNLTDPAALYAMGDVAIQPSKMEGLGFMVLEAVASGLPVLTTDYPPMNEYVRQPEMLVRKRWFKRAAFPTRAAGIRHAHLRLPCIRDLARKIVWCAENNLASISKQNRSWAEVEFNPDEIRAKWQTCLARCIKNDVR